MDLGPMLVQALPRLRRYALAICKDGDIANDLVQTACERTLLARGPEGDGVSALARLFATIRTLWLDRLQSQSTPGVPSASDELGRDHAESLPRAVPEDRYLDAREQIERVQAALQHLPDAQRELLLLVCVEALSYQDAAAVLKLPMDTLMTQLAHARSQLAQWIGLSAPSQGVRHD